ncbi:hypothetical protein RchiOBHm_Chr3g0488401 [Rosa chinensis]|uniref:Uncharacterized protein n=1 Tax=Rosa chinensis TaxID=74649 RepID=A0A2P6RFU5_ROSCH|nr:hypothetical protein RchiOBHm_Chr3g0488401 [Rosa chinensis]
MPRNGTVFILLMKTATWLRLLQLPCWSLTNFILCLISTLCCSKTLYGRETAKAVKLIIRSKSNVNQTERLLWKIKAETK